MVGPATARQLEADRLQRDLEDLRRPGGDVNGLADGADDNLMRGVEGNRPGIGPKPFEPSWTLPDDDGLTQKEIDELKRQLEEAENN